MSKKFSMEEAKVIIEKFKKQFKINTPKGPNWISSVGAALQQDGDHHISICIPSWECLPPDANEFCWNGFDGMKINLRVVKPRNENYQKSKDDGKKIK